jgi:hypothetical protein
MALVECSECKAKISDKALSCPKCGYIFSIKNVLKIEKPSVNKSFETLPPLTTLPLESETKKQNPLVLWLVAALVVLVVILVVLLSNQKSGVDTTSSRNIYPSQKSDYQPQVDDKENQRMREQLAAAEAEKQHLSAELKRKQDSERKMLASQVSQESSQTALTENPVESPNTNLVAWWKLNEGSGRTVNDSSGNNHTGQLSGGASWNSGGGINFNGGRNAVIFEDSPFQLNEGSLELLVNISQFNNGIIMEKDNYGYVGDGRLIALPNGDVYFELQGISQSSGAGIQSPAQANTDLQIIVEWGPRGMKLFINNQLVASNPNTSSITSPGRPLTLGSTLSSSMNSFIGVIKEVKVYNTNIK